MQINPLANTKVFTYLGRTNTIAGISVAIDTTKYTFVGLCRTTSNSDNRIFNPTWLPIEAVKSVGTMVLSYTESGSEHVFRLTYNSGDNFTLSCDTENPSFYVMCLVW